MRNKSAVMVVIVLCCSLSFAQPYAWQDPGAVYLNTQRTLGERVDDLMRRLTSDQKIMLMHDRENEVPGLVPSYDINGEALHGVLRPGAFTSFPSALGMAASWDTSLFLSMATAISDEARARYNELNGNPDKGCALLAFWAPVINMGRDPRWGRIGECYGEDPYLSGRLGIAYVKGLQGNDPKYVKCIATLKHFAVYSQETGRGSLNINVNEQLLREYYLEAFRVGIQEGRAASVMSAYTSLNGIPNSCNKRMLTDILKREWGFDGFICCDCGASDGISNDHHYTAGPLQSVAAMVNAGLDWEAKCSWGNYLYQSYLGQTISQGLTTTAMLDSAARRVIAARIKSGILDAVSLCPYNAIPFSKRGSPEILQVARQMVRESIVLLKNANVTTAPLLPINKTLIRTIAVLGIDAGVVRFDSYACHTPPNLPVCPLEGIIAQAGGSITVKYVPYPGSSYQYSHLDTVFYPDDQTRHGFKGEYFSNTTLAGTPKIRRDTIIDFNTDLWNGWAKDTMFLPVPFSVRWTGIIRPAYSGQYQMAVRTDDGVRVYLDNQLMLDRWINRSATTDNVNFTFQAGRRYTLRIEYFNANSGTGTATMTWAVPGRDNLDSARRAAASSDLVILCMGSTNEDEGTDRTTIAVPTDQRSYIQQIFAANPKTVLVCMARSPVALTWEQQNLPAILLAWWPGEEAGNGIADVLFGACNPAGRLPVTYYSADNQLLALNEYDITKGRTYLYFTGQPLYPFGFGLSYTTFSYSNLRLTYPTAGPQCTTEVKVNLTNTGSRAGDEVPQLYIRDNTGNPRRPIRQLRGFARVALQPGETKTITFRLPYRDLACYDTTVKNWNVRDGAFDVMVGSSSADIKLTTQLTADRTFQCVTGTAAEGTQTLRVAVPGPFAALSGSIMTLPGAVAGKGYAANVFNMQGRKLGSVPITKCAKIRIPSQIVKARSLVIIRIEKERK